MRGVGAWLVDRVHVVGYIENVYGDRISALRAIYKFGTLHIQTKDKKYKIGVVNNILEIEKYIYSKIAWKFKY